MAAFIRLRYAAIFPVIHQENLSAQENLRLLRHLLAPLPHSNDSVIWIRSENTKVVAHQRHLLSRSAHHPMTDRPLRPFTHQKDVGRQLLVFIYAPYGKWTLSLCGLPGPAAKKLISGRSAPPMRYEREPVFPKPPQPRHNVTIGLVTTFALRIKVATSTSKQTETRELQKKKPTPRGQVAFVPLAFNIDGASAIFKARSLSRALLLSQQPSPWLPPPPAYNPPTPHHSGP